MIASRYRAWLEGGDPSDLEPELAPLLPALGAQARHLLGHASDADDAVQDAMVELLRSRSRIPPDLPLAAIVHRLLWERAIMQRRTRHRRHLRSSTMTSELTAPDPHPPGRDAEAMLARLSPGERQVFLGLAQGLSQKELADQGGLTPATLAGRLRRLRRRLAPSRRP